MTLTFILPFEGSEQQQRSVAFDVKDAKDGDIQIEEQRNRTNEKP